MNVIQQLEAECDRIGLDAQARIYGLRQAINILRGGCPTPASTAEAPTPASTAEAPTPASTAEAPTPASTAKILYRKSCTAMIAEAAQELAASGTQIFDQVKLRVKAIALHPEEAIKLRFGVYHAVNQLITAKVIMRVPGGFSLAIPLAKKVEA